MANKLVSLKRRADFFTLQKKGKRIRLCPWMMIVFLANEAESSRFGWTIPKKVGPSVVRNRLKRWLRDYFRQNQPTKNFDINVVLRTYEKNFFKNITHRDFIEQVERASKKLK